MSASRIAVIYASNSKIIRRVIVSDTDNGLDQAITLDNGEDVLFVETNEYTKENAEHINKLVASAIGEPAHSGRCVEIDTKGEVVAVYCADPEIDMPFDSSNTLEQHDYAEVGDKKDETGKFPVKKAEIPADFDAAE